jgi:hypothetical protein
MAKTEVTSQEHNPPLIYTKSGAISMALFPARAMANGRMGSRNIQIQKSWVGKDSGETERRKLSVFEGDYPNLLAAVKQFAAQYEQLEKG